MTSDEIKKISLLINGSLDKAEYHWQNGGYQLMLESSESRDLIKANAQDEAISRIPGHNIVRSNETIIDEFVAMVVDMRDSTQHLMCATAKDRGIFPSYNEFFMKHQHFYQHLKQL
ncbi:hypothetical protein O3W44_21405 [Pantoea sp. LMR881]|uniref:hypothetical protein n=1 Tax=Pantoea sp. LMR881 TaxID=3014336 RepID=UPI0022B07EB0|nr:hypothetical protein [Pantoea sp. LMR881]MCZ4061101.1 hypothetical protein [Pantoea sp. LMR881]